MSLEQEPRPDRLAWLKRAVGPIVAGAIALAKWSFVLVKFGSLFVALAAYALIWGWRWAIGFVALIAVHELGHYIEARREGLRPRFPIFLPFMAYVRFELGNPWQLARVAIAGPILGGAGSLALLIWGEASGSQLLKALAFSGFFLNLFNCIPMSFFDGGQVLRAAGWLRRGGAPNRAFAIYALYAATVAMLILGMVQAHVHQTRL